jgi:hypothetical protein
LAWAHRKPSRSVRLGGDTIRAGSNAGGEIRPRPRVLAVTGFGDVRVFIDGQSNKSVDRDSVHDDDALHRLGCVIPPAMTRHGHAFVAGVQRE